MSDITLEKVDQVIDRTGCSYKEAKEALTAANGDVLDAIIYLTGGAKSTEDTEETTERFTPFDDDFVERLKEKISLGNVTKVRVTRNGEKLAEIPIVYGAAGALVSLALAPHLVLLGGLAAYGLDVRVELIKDDGSSEDFR